MSKIKWGCIQPLTGGMYIGAARAIGHEAEWIISYPGLRDIKKNKEGKITTAGNEYNLYSWFEKNNINVPYYVFNRPQFSSTFTNTNETEILDENNDVISIDYSDIDLVVAVPVCSGLSRVSTSNKETKDERNCNMVFIAQYTLNVIKPKIYIFENAPELYTARGEEVREILNKMAFDAGYSVLYYKTDTQYHDNCQKRPRTFVIFQKWDANEQQTPHIYNFERIEAKLKDYLAQIPEDATQQTPIPMTNFNRCLIDYAKFRFGDDWRSKSYRDTMANFVKEGRWKEFLYFMHTRDYIDSEQMAKYDKFVNHAEFKVSQGLNYYSMSAYLSDPDKVGSVQFKSMSSYLHPVEDRHYTVREALHLMGMPHDFELHGEMIANFPKIGQNVPVRTAQWIVSEAVRIIENWDSLNDRTPEKNVLFIDNVKQHIEV